MAFWEAVSEEVSETIGEFGSERADVPPFPVGEVIVRVVEPRGGPSPAGTLRTTEIVRLRDDRVAWYDDDEGVWRVSPGPVRTGFVDRIMKRRKA